MITFKTSQDNDFFTVGGNLQLSRDVDAAADVSRQYGLTIRGEMIHDVPSGVDYFGTMFNGRPDAFLFEASLRRRLSQIKEVKTVDYVHVIFVEDVAKYTALITTIFGQIEVSNGNL